LCILRRFHATRALGGCDFPAPLFYDTEDLLTTRHTLALLMLSVTPACAAAQAVPDSIHLRNDCRLAGQVLTTGHPRPRLQWAAELMPRCPGVGMTVADALLRNRTWTDTAQLHWMTQPANSLQDGRTFNAALSVLRDEAASPESRVYAARVLYWLLYPSAGVYYSTLTDADGDGHWPCVLFGGSSHLRLIRGEPLPTDWRIQLHSTASAIMRDDLAPQPVRQSAVCLVLRGSAQRGG
jgi:hypothetical protein